MWGEGVISKDSDTKCRMDDIVYCLAGLGTYSTHLLPTLSMLVSSWCCWISDWLVGWLVGGKAFGLSVK